MEYEKGNYYQLSDNFNSGHFDCKCSYVDCVSTLIDPLLVSSLEELLEMVGEFRITSGFRCAKHNKDVKGEKASKHLLGIAADIESVRGFTGSQLSKYVLQIDAFERGGLGVAEGWVHVDVRKMRGRWVYPIIDS